MSENLVKKETEDEEEYEEYEELPEENEHKEEKEQKSIKDFLPKNKITRYMLIFMIVFTVLCLFVWIISLFIKKNYTYEEVENVLKEAAVDYFADYKDSLPQEEGQIVEIDSSNLVQAEKMKELSYYTGKNLVCEGTVQVEKADGSYLYTPYLDCGESYKTQKLSEAIISQGLAKQGQYGLYKLNGEYVYRGENINNYVKLDEGLWRIVKITANNNVVLVKQEKVGYTVPYDDRFNVEKAWDSGINNYSSSRIKDYLELYYSKPNEKNDQKYLSSKDKTHLVKYDLCIGKRTPEDVDNSNEKECTALEKNVKVGLLTASDYMRASLDSNCTNTTNKSCANYNYLVYKEEYWLATGNAANSYEAYYVKKSGEIKLNETCGYFAIRPVVYLNNNTMFKSGTGSESKPFKIK